MSYPIVIEQYESDTRPTDELVELALAASDEEERWDLVKTLRYRGNQAEFDIAVRLAQSELAVERELGADILAQLGCFRQGTFITDSVDVLLVLLQDSSEDVLYSAIIGLGHRGDDRAVPSLCGFADHRDRDIRYAVTFALCGHKNELAVRTLIALSNDTDAEVRDWATFGLGRQIELDTPEIREALYARVTDEDDEVRAEALMGLANRNDDRALDLVKLELSREEVDELVFEAAEHLADEHLLPALQNHRALWQEGDDTFHRDRIDDAIKACSPSEMP